MRIFDPRLGANRTQTNWLNGDDPLDEATRDYLKARREAMQNGPRPAQSGWAAASAARARDTANQRALQARARARQILEQRGVINQAGLTVTPPR
jgi:hypothetical protein